VFQAKIDLDDRLTAFHVWHLDFGGAASNCLILQVKAHTFTLSFIFTRKDKYQKSL
jgi:hypothetical protein